MGWTHTSAWATFTLATNQWVTVRHQREAGVPWPSLADSNRTASIANMNPSFTLYQGYQDSGADSHTYNNRGNIVWAPALGYLDHEENTSKSFVEETWFLPAGQYTLALGSNAPSNDTNRQGYRTILTTSTVQPVASTANASATDPNPGAGIGYAWSAELDANDRAEFAGHVGAWSWEDQSLFNAGNGEPPVGWTHTSAWATFTLSTSQWVTVRHQREAGVPWPSVANPARTASIANMNPSFTLYQGYQGTGGDHHTYNNRGNIDWALALTYQGHVENTECGLVQQTWFLPAGQYSLALGSNAPSNDTNRQGYRTQITTSTDRPGQRLLPALTAGVLAVTWEDGLQGFVIESSEDLSFSAPQVEHVLGGSGRFHTSQPAPGQSSRFYRLRAALVQ